MAAFRFNFNSDFTMPKYDPYQVLGISKRASNDEIKKAYRKKAKVRGRFPNLTHTGNFS